VCSSHGNTWGVTPLALEVAAAENLALKDGVDNYPAPEGVAGDDSTRVGSVSHGPAPEGIAGDDPAQVGSANYDPAPEGVAGDDSTRVGSVSHGPAPEGIAGDDPAQVGSANYDPTPEGVRAGSPSCTSMDVHAGSPPHSGCMVVAQAFGQGVALEASVPDDQVLGSADDTELVHVGSL
jgi:hypothetical protein